MFTNVYFTKHNVPFCCTLFLCVYYCVCIPTVKRGGGGGDFLKSKFCYSYSNCICLSIQYNMYFLIFYHTTSLSNFFPKKYKMNMYYVLSRCAHIYFIYDIHKLYYAQRISTQRNGKLLRAEHQYCIIIFIGSYTNVEKQERK